MDYRRASHRATNSLEARGRGAVGSAQPCQGWGRGFESRRPLDGADASTPAVEWPSGEATACKAVHTGSIPVSTSILDPGAISSAGERFPDTEEVTGSIPVSRTSFTVGSTMHLRQADDHPSKTWACPQIPDFSLEPVALRLWCYEAADPGSDETPQTRCPTIPIATVCGQHRRAHEPRSPIGTPPPIDVYVRL